jgi:hypothetical protein
MDGDAPGRLELTSCAQCGLPAEVTGRFTLASTQGEVEHLVTVCVHGHWLTPCCEAAGDAIEAGHRTLPTPAD